MIQKERTARRSISSLLFIFSLLFFLGQNTSFAQGTWIDQSLNITQRFWASSFKDTTTGWIVGEQGVIYKTTNAGYAWQQLVSGVSNYLSGVHFVGDEGWACGESGTILHTVNGGANWSPQTSGVTQALYDIYFTDAMNGIACGSSRTIIYTSNGGTNWYSGNVPGSSVSLYGCFLVGSTGYACGGSGRIYKSTDGGVNWTIMTSPVNVQLEGIHFVDANTGYMTGANGSVVKTTNGSTFNALTPIAPPGNYYACSFIDANTGWTLESGITVKHTTDGGASWQSQSTPITSEMNGIEFLNATNGWAVGKPGKIIHYSIMLPIIDADASHDFGSLLCGNVKYDTLFVRNIGHAPLIISSATLSGTNAGEFTISSPANGIATINAQDSARYIIKWLTNATGTKTASLKLTSNDPNSPNRTMLLTGKKDSATVQVSPLVLDCGSLCIGDSLVKTLTAITGGDAASSIVDLTRISGDDMFSLAGQPLPYQFSLGSADSIRIQFRPRKSGAIQAVYRITIEPCNRKFLVTFRGIGLQSLVDINPSSGHNFGSVNVGLTATKQFTVRGAGNTSTRIASIEIVPPLAEFVLQNPPTLPVTLAVGQEKNFSIDFTPSTGGLLAASLCIVWDAECPDTLCVPLTGAGGAIAKIDAPQHVVFATQICAAPVDDTIMIKNIGTGPLTISQAQITGVNPSSFSLLLPTIPTTIAVNDSLAFILRFNDATAGFKSALLTLTHNDTQNSPTEIVLNGERGSASFTMQGDTLQVLQSCIGVGSARTLKILNNGSEALTITQLDVIENGNIFHVSSDPLPMKIQPGQLFPIEINFTPSSTGQITGKLFIAGTPCGVSRVLTLRGIGIKVELSPSANSISFGSVNIGASQDRSIDISNVGNLNGTIQQLVILPPTVPVQLVSPPTLPLRLDVGQKQNFTLRYTPNVTEILQAQFCVITGTPCQDTICIPLNGNAVSSSLSINRASLQFTHSPCAIAADCDTIRLTNSNPTEVEITSISISDTTVFSLQPNPSTPFMLARNTSLLLTVCSNGSFIGARSATLTIVSKDPMKPSIGIPLSANRDSSSIIASSAKLDFGTLASCEPGKGLTLLLTNNGTVPEIISSPKTIDPAFSFTPPFPIILQIGETKQIDVKFAPTMDKAFTDTLTLETSVCNTVKKIILTGVRAKGTYTLSIPALDFRNTAVGSSISKTIRFTNAGTFPTHLESLFTQPAISGLTDNFIAGDVAPNGFIDVIVTFNPSDTALRTGRMCFIVTSPCPDTICFAVQTKGAKGSITFSKAQLQFPSLTQCEALVDSIVCLNSGTQTISILNVGIAGVDAASFQLSNTFSLPITLLPGKAQTFLIQCKPIAGADGVLSARLSIDTDEAAAPHVELALQGARITQSLPQNLLIGFGTTLLGTNQDRQVRVRNSGSSRFCITQSLLPPDFSVLSQMPFCLQPGEEKILTIRWEGTSKILRLDTIMTFVVGQPCIDTLRVKMQGTRITGKIVQTDYHFHSLPGCFSVLDTISISNETLDSIAVESLLITGQDSLSFRILSPTSFPVVISPAGKLLILVYVDTLGAMTESITRNGYIHSVIKTISGRESFSSRIHVQSRLPSLTSTSLQFGTVLVGSSIDQTIMLNSTETKPVAITAIRIADPAFSILSIFPPLPADISSATPLLITIRFAPTAAKAYSVQMDVDITGVCRWSAGKTLLGTGYVSPITQFVHASIPTIHGKPDDIVRIPINVDQDLGSSKVVSWSGNLRFNRTMLYPLRLDNAGTRSKNMNVQFQYDHVTGTLNMTGDNASLTSGTEPLIVVECRVLLGNDVDSPIELTPIFDLTSGIARISQRTSGLFQLEGYCRAGDRLLRITGNFSLAQNHPNPFGAATQAGNSITTIAYEIAHDGHALLTVHNTLGEEVARLTDAWEQAGKHEVRFDASGLPGGLYYYMLRTGKFSSVKKMSIVK